MLVLLKPYIELVLVFLIYFFILYSIKKPLYGLFIFLFFSPFENIMEHFHKFPFGNDLFDLFIIFMLIGILINKKTDNNITIPASIKILFSFYILIIFASIFLSPFPNVLVLQFISIKNYLIFFIVFYLSFTLIDSKKKLNYFVILITITIIWADISFLREARYMNFSSYSDKLRNSGIFINLGSNELAAFYAYIMFFFFGQYRYSEGKKKYIYLFLAISNILIVLYTFSRGAYLGIAAGFLIYGILKNKKILILLFIFAITWQFILPESVIQRITMTENAEGQLDQSAESRIILWERALDLIQEYPVLGIGFDSFRFVDTGFEDLHNPHNYYIQAFVETGILGLIFLLTLFIKAAVSGCYVNKWGTNNIDKGLGLALFLMTTSLMIMNIFGNRWSYFPLITLYWAIFGVTIRLQQMIKFNANVMFYD